MKTYKFFVLILLIFLANINYAQNVDEKTRNYFTNVNIENENFNASLYNIVSKFEYLKFAIKIENKTPDFIVWDNSDSKIVFDWGEETPLKGKIIKIKAYGSKTPTFGVKGGTKMLVDHFKFIQNGISRVSVNGITENVEEFKLPASKNSISSNNFSIVLKKTKKKTDETYAKFEVTYTGDKVAVIKLNEISVRVNTNDVFANDYKKSTHYLLTKGEKMAFTVKFHVPSSTADMQFADMFIQWNKAFSISEKKPISGIETSIVLNKDLTESNK